MNAVIFIVLNSFLIKFAVGEGRNFANREYSSVMHWSNVLNRVQIQAHVGVLLFYPEAADESCRPQTSSSFDKMVFKSLKSDSITNSTTSSSGFSSLPLTHSTSLLPTWQHDLVSIGNPWQINIFVTPAAEINCYINKSPDYRRHIGNNCCF